MRDLFKTGEIINLQKEGQYGFIKSDKSADRKKGNIFFHGSGLKEALFNDLEIGSVVAYSLEENPKGRSRAVEIELLPLVNKQKTWRIN